MELNTSLEEKHLNKNESAIPVQPVASASQSVSIFFSKIITMQIGIMLNKTLSLPKQLKRKEIHEIGRRNQAQLIRIRCGASLRRRRDAGVSSPRNALWDVPSKIGRQVKSVVGGSHGTVVGVSPLDQNERCGREIRLSATHNTNRRSPKGQLRSRPRHPCQTVIARTNLVPEATPLPA